MATTEANVDISIPFDTETILFDISNGQLSTLLEIICKSIGISSSSKSTHVTLVPNDGPCEQIDVAVLGDENYNLRQLNKRLGEEVSMLNFILDEVGVTTRTIDERNKSQVHWTPKSKPKSSSEITDITLRIVWLIYELNRCQLSVLKLAQSGKISQFGTNGMVKIETMPVDQWTAAYSNPLFRPLPDDLKPSNISFETFILVRDFVFNKTDINPVVRVELVRSLQREQMGHLQRTPEDFFLDMVRCMGMSGQEFINACFKYSKDGKKLARPRCPCGVHLKETSAGIRKHADKCRFSEFVLHRCPSILQDSLYCSTQVGRVMGTKETAYIIDVIKKRLPRDEWKNTFCGAHLQKEEVVQGN